MFDREEKFCTRVSNFLYDNYKNIETKFSVDYFKIKVIVTSYKEFYYDDSSYFLRRCI